MAMSGPVTIGLMVTVLEAWTVPRPVSTTGTSVALTDATVTGVGWLSPGFPLRAGWASVRKLRASAAPPATTTRPSTAIQVRLVLRRWGGSGGVRSDIDGLMG